MTLDGVFTPLGGGAPVRFIQSMGVQKANQFTNYDEPFNAPPTGTPAAAALGWTYLHHSSFSGSGVDRFIGFWGHSGIRNNGVLLGSAVPSNTAMAQGEVSLLSQPNKDAVWVGLARDIGNIDTSQSFTLSMYCLMHDNGDGEGKVHRGSYRIYAHLSDLEGASVAGNQLEDGFEVTLEFVGLDAASPFTRTDGFWRIFCRKYAAGGIIQNETAIGVFAGGDKDGRFTVQFDDQQVTIYFDGEELGDFAMTAVAPITKSSKIGFGMNPYFTNDQKGPGGVNEHDMFTIVDDLALQYYKTGGNDLEIENREIVVASAGGELYREENSGDLSLESDAGVNYATLNDDVPIMVQDFVQKLYIADHRDILADYENGVISGSTLTSASVANFNAVGGIDLDGTSEKLTWAVRLYNVQGVVAEDVYQIASATGGNLVLNRVPGDGNTAFRIERGPKIYDPSDGTMVLWDVGTWTAGNEHEYPLVRKGFVPDGCHLICEYRRRLVLAGNPPYAFYMSRIGDPLDFYTAGRISNPEDLAGATGGTVEGGVAMFLTGVIPFTDDYLLFTGRQRLDMLRGDVALGGEIDNLSHEIGMIGDTKRPSNAYCYGPSGEVVLLSQDGVYIVYPGAFPQSISAVKIPRELFDIDASLYDVYMSYDAKDHGVHIFVTLRTGGVGGRRGHYWMEWGQNTFWPMEYPSGVLPTALGKRSPAAEGFSVSLIGSTDGFIRRFAYHAETDDGTNINSYILIGPFRISGTDVDEGIFSELSAEVSSDGGSVTWSLWTGVSPEAVAKRAMSGETADETGLFPTGSTKTAHPHRVGMAAILKLQNATGRAWSMERLTASLMRAGIQRVN